VSIYIQVNMACFIQNVVCGTNSYLVISIILKRYMQGWHGLHIAFTLDKVNYLHKVVTHQGALLSVAIFISNTLVLLM
jgi:hypothetical protein